MHSEAEAEVHINALKRYLAKDARRYTKYNVQNDRINEYSNESNRYAFIGGCGAEAYGGGAC